jgi:hypothetical protein
MFSANIQILLELSLLLSLILVLLFYFIFICSAINIAYQLEYNIMHEFNLSHELADLSHECLNIYQSDREKITLSLLFNEKLVNLLIKD